MCRHSGGCRKHLRVLAVYPSWHAHTSRDESTAPLLSTAWVPHDGRTDLVCCCAVPAVWTVVTARTTRPVRACLFTPMARTGQPPSSCICIRTCIGIRIRICVRISYSLVSGTRSCHTLPDTDTYTAQTHTLFLELWAIGAFVAIVSVA